MGELSTEDRSAVQRARRLVRFLTQPFVVTAQFTGEKGVSVSIEDTLTGCEAILRGDTDSWDEASLYMVGTLGDARRKQEQSAKGKPG
jgi:F-type H+-transporting ATPase subunit beta